MALALAAAPMTAGCVPPGSYQEEDSISDRGGFLDPEQRLAPAPDSDYCAAEVLRWRYDELLGTLRITDARLLLGCCGQRTLTVERVDSLLEITERDVPEGGRCDSACVFDFAVTLPGIPPGPHVVRLLRDVTDAQGGPNLVWQGEIHLPGQGGALVLNETPAPGCRDTSP
jgi:hypothetical protein